MDLICSHSIVHALYQLICLFSYFALVMFFLSTELGYRNWIHDFPIGSKSSSSCVDRLDSLGSLSRHLSLSSIGLSSSSRWHLVSAQSWWLANVGVSVYGCPQKNIIFAFLAVPSMSCFSYLDGLWGGRQVTCCFMRCWFQDLFKTVAASLCSFHLAFSLSALLKPM